MVIPTPTSTAIHNSDSCNTLVSLDQQHRGKRARVLVDVDDSQSTSSSSTTEWRKTALILPDGSSLNLPLHHGLPCDEYLRQHVPAIRESAKQLLATSNQHHLFTEDSPETLLYVHQAEVAHAIPSQCDLLVTDRATTCHILALRSTSDSQAPPLTTLTHLDKTCYEPCLRQIFQQHKEHHTTAIDEDDLFFDKAIAMDVHLVGGFCDPDGISQNLSQWILHLLATVADEEASCFELMLRTCAISSLNNNNNNHNNNAQENAPRARGLAIDTRTGNIMLAKTSPKVVGPSIPLRNARLWSSDDQAPAPLHVIHTPQSPYLQLQPFVFGPMEGMDDFLSMDDDALIEYTSTSPQVEEDDFCHVVRQTLQFILGVSCETVFGPYLDRPLTFARQHHGSNQWQLILSSA